MTVYAYTTLVGFLLAIGCFLALALPALLSSTRRNEACAFGAAP